MFNLEDSFEDIKLSIQDQPYASKIAYKDNETKPIGISELLRLMYAFDIEKYPDDKMAPIQSYSGKAQVFKRYKDAFSGKFYKSLTKQLPKLTELYDIIEREMSDKYGEYKRALESPFQDSEESKALSMLKAELRQNFLKTRLNIQSQADTFIQFTVPFVLF